MNIATTIATPRHHDANRPFGAAHMIKPAAKRTDAAALTICKDPIPSYRAVVGSKYAPIFAKLRPGEAIKCKPEEVGRIANSLRKYIEQGHAKGAVKTIKNYGDGMGRVWLIEAE